MKRIVKTREPLDFMAWKRGSDPGWVPSYPALPRTIRTLLIAALRAEQGALCCYCMCRIPPDDVEHLKPQAICKPREDVAYRNLLASCRARNADGTNRSPARCNGKRGDRPLLVSPLQADCERYFTFNLDGVIQPTPVPHIRARAESVIDILGLAEPSLTARRAAAIRGLGLEEVEPGEIRQLKQLYEGRDGEGRFKEFAGAISYVLAQWDSSKKPGRTPSKRPEPKHSRKRK